MFKFGVDLPEKDENVIVGNGVVLLGYKRMFRILYSLLIQTQYSGCVIKSTDRHSVYTPIISSIFPLPVFVSLNLP